jgi:hypothetical protein
MSQADSKLQAGIKLNAYRKQAKLGNRPKEASRATLGSRKKRGPAPDELALPFDFYLRLSERQFLKPLY